MLFHGLEDIGIIDVHGVQDGSTREVQAVDTQFVGLVLHDTHHLELVHLTPRLPLQNVGRITVERDIAPVGNTVGQLTSGTDRAEQRCYVERWL